ncbi:MAG: hypothetical protein AB8B83_03610 [Bdellovibrionales bacterium]
MAGHIEKREVLYVLFVVCFVFGVFYFYKGQYFLNDFHRASGQSRTVVGVAEHNRANKEATVKFRKAVEASINELLSDVFLEMQEYRKRRKALGDIVQPKNLSDPKTIVDTYTIMRQTTADLRARSDRIIKIFANKDAELKNLIKGRSASAQKNILSAWSKVKAEQVDLYVRYFSIEQSILQRYDELTALYFQNRNDVVFYADANSVAFRTQALNQQATALNTSIRQLQKQQASL